MSFRGTLPYSAAIHTGDEAFAALLPEWAELCAHCPPQPFFDPAWCSTWRRTLDPGRPPVVFAVRNTQNQLVALMPFVAVPGIGGSGLWPMGFHTGDFFQPLVHANFPAAIGSLFDRLITSLKRHPFIWLPLLPESVWAAIQHSAAPDTVKQLAAARARVVDSRLSLNPQTADFSPSGKNEKKRRYEERKLGEIGPVRYETLATSDAVAAFMPQLGRLERQSWKGKAGTGFFRLPRSREFYGELLPALAGHGKACIEVLYAGEVVVAAQVGLTAANYHGLHNTAYHEGYAEFSPGSHLLTYSLDQARKNGVTCYDFMQGTQAYKQERADRREGLLEIAFFAPNLVGRAYRLLTRPRRAQNQQPTAWKS